MRFHAELILQKLKPYKVRGLKFKIGKIKLRDISMTTDRVGSASLPPKEITEMVEAATSLIADQRLRDSIKRAMEKSLLRTQRL